MNKTDNPFLDELAKLMTGAAGAAQGIQKEIEMLFRTQGEQALSQMGFVRREEFEAVQSMAQKAREENKSLKQRLDSLEKHVKKDHESAI